MALVVLLCTIVWGERSSCLSSSIPVAKGCNPTVGVSVLPSLKFRGWTVKMLQAKKKKQLEALGWYAARDDVTSCCCCCSTAGRASDTAGRASAQELATGQETRQLTWCKKPLERATRKVMQPISEKYKANRFLRQSSWCWPIMVDGQRKVYRRARLATDHARRVHIYNIQIRKTKITRYIFAPLQLMSTYDKTCTTHPITLVTMQNGYLKVRLQWYYNPPVNHIM